MSVRPTQTKSRYPRRTRQPYPVDERDPTPADNSGRSPAEGDDGVADPGPEVESRVAGRKAQRAARRARRTVAVVCGVVVALCLILTILIVDMARTRSSAPLVVANPAVMSLGPSRAPTVPSPTPNHPTLDAPASEGGNP
jgi:hypothetical protein